MSKRDEVIEKLKQQLDFANSKLDELEEKADQVSGEARQKYEEQMSHLREMSQPARDKLDALKAASESQWDSLSAEADKIYKALVHSFNYFKSQVK
jgi:vacuolar-type H+-ATPase subunit H